MITRRQVLAGALATPMAGQALAQGQRPIYLSDMHFHSFFGDSVYHARPVAKSLADGQATLVSWSLVGDLLWFDARVTFKQNATPKPREARAWFQREIARIKAHMQEQGLKPALQPQDIDRALAGEPRIVLSVEGASFIETVGDVQDAYAAGIRHLQLVHYIRNPLGDFQSEPPQHNGLTQLGRDVIAACNRLGILVDLAHCSPATVTGALAVGTSPMIWSHGSVTTGPAPHPGLITWKARQLHLPQAEAIARSGGVVGLWALAPDVGRTPADYGRRLLELADWLGDEHVGFGTDINGLGRNAALSSYAELRRVVDDWQRQQVPEQRIRRIAGENYARVLRRAMAMRA